MIHYSWSPTGLKPSVSLLAAINFIRCLKTLASHLHPHSTNGQRASLFTSSCPDRHKFILGGWFSGRLPSSVWIEMPSSGNKESWSNLPLHKRRLCVRSRVCPHEASRSVKTFHKLFLNKNSSCAHRCSRECYTVINSCLNCLEKYWRSPGKVLDIYRYKCVQTVLKCKIKIHKYTSEE